MATKEFMNIFISIILFKPIVSDLILVQKVNSAKLQPMPYRQDDVYLLGLSLKRRQELCTYMRTQIDEFVFAASYTYYIPAAHLYKFKIDSDTEEDWLALQCTTFPPIYISHDWVDKRISSDNHQWYVRMVKPQFIDEYKFNFEIASCVSNAKAEELVSQKLPLKEHIFQNMNRKMRWFICDEARKRVRYEIDIEKQYRNESPQFYEFTYNEGGTEIIFAIRCFGIPYLYVHAEHEFSTEENVFTVVIAYDNEKDEMTPTKNVVNQSFTT